jgi:hypothetical protein
MQESLRTVVAGAAGAVVATAVLTAPPVLADQAERAARKVTSAQIKDGTVKAKDLDRSVNASLAKANSAMQGIPKGSVTFDKLADGAVASPQLADGGVATPDLRNGAVTGPKIAPDAVGSGAIANGSVTGTDVADGTLTGADVSDGSLGSGDYGQGTVGSTAVTDGSLRLTDVAQSSGVETIDFPGLSSGQCAQSGAIVSGLDLDNAIILVENPATVAGSIHLLGRQAQPGFTSFVIIACAVGGAFDPPSTDYAWAVLR